MVHLHLQVPASVPRLDDLIPIVIILRHAVEVTGIRHGFHHPPPQTVEGGFVDGHVRIVQRRFNKPIPGVVGVFEVAVEGEIAVVVVRGVSVVVVGGCVFIDDDHRFPRLRRRQATRIRVRSLSGQLLAR